MECNKSSIVLPLTENVLPYQWVHRKKILFSCKQLGKFNLLCILPKIGFLFYDPEDLKYEHGQTKIHYYWYASSFDNSDEELKKINDAYLPIVGGENFCHYEECTQNIYFFGLLEGVTSYDFNKEQEVFNFIDFTHAEKTLLTSNPVVQYLKINEDMHLIVFKNFFMIVYDFCNKIIFAFDNEITHGRYVLVEKKHILLTIDRQCCVRIYDIEKYITHAKQTCTPKLSIYPSHTLLIKQKNTVEVPKYINFIPEQKKYIVMFDTILLICNTDGSVMDVKKSNNQMCWTHFAYDPAPRKFLACCTTEQAESSDDQTIKIELLST